jgi:hypothetical protein
MRYHICHALSGKGAEWSTAVTHPLAFPRFLVLSIDHWCADGRYCSCTRATWQFWKVVLFPAVKQRFKKTKRWKAHLFSLVWWSLIQQSAKDCNFAARFKIRQFHTTPKRNTVVPALRTTRFTNKPLYEPSGLCFLGSLCELNSLYEPEKTEEKKSWKSNRIRLLSA